MSVNKFDYTKRSFDANFYIWWLTDDPNYYPEKSIEITDSYNTQLLSSSRDKVLGKTRVQARYNATITKNWDLKFFPFDRQRMVISLEDNLLDINQLDFKPLESRTAMHSGSIYGPWTIKGFHLERTENTYETNFGDITTPKSTFARMSLIIELKRKGASIFFVYFIGFFVAAFLCFGSYFLPIALFSDRNTLTLGSIFAAIGNKYYIDNTISVSSSFSLSDTIAMCTFLLILLTLVNNIATNIVLTSGNQLKALRLNRITLITVLLTYIFIIAGAIVVAIRS